MKYFAGETQCRLGGGGPIFYSKCSDSYSSFFLGPLLDIGFWRLIIHCDAVWTRTLSALRAYQFLTEIIRTARVQILVVRMNLYCV